MKKLHSKAEFDGIVTKMEIFCGMFFRRREVNSTIVLARMYEENSERIDT